MRHEWTPRTRDAALAADDLEGGRRGFWIQTVTGTFMTLDGPFGSEIAAEMLRVESERRALAERVRGLEQLSASRLDIANKATDEAAKAQERAAQAEEANRRLTARVGDLEVCSDAVGILEELRIGDPVFDDAKAFALAIVEKHRTLEAEVGRLQKTSADVRTKLLDAIEGATVYVQWINGKSQAVDEPFVPAVEIRAALDGISPAEDS